MMVAVFLPGWHWEVEFMADGSVEVERHEPVAGVQSDPKLARALFADTDPAWRSAACECDSLPEHSRQARVRKCVTVARRSQQVRAEMPRII